MARRIAEQRQRLFAADFPFTEADAVDAGERDPGAGKLRVTLERGPEAGFSPLEVPEATAFEKEATFLVVVARVDVGTRPIGAGHRCHGARVFACPCLGYLAAAPGADHQHDGRDECGDDGTEAVGRSMSFFGRLRIGCGYAADAVVEDIAAPRHGLDHLEAAVCQCAADIGDTVCERIVGNDNPLPHGIVQRGLRNQPAVVVEQDREYLERLGPQVHFVVAAEEHPAVEVHREFTEAAQAVRLVAC